MSPPPPPLLRKRTPAPYFQPFLKFFRCPPPPPGEVIKIYFLPLLKRGYWGAQDMVGITLVDILQNWLNWFHFLFLEGDLLIILIDCMIFLSIFRDGTKMSMSTVCLFTHLDSGILCLYNVFL